MKAVKSKKLFLSLSTIFVLLLTSVVLVGTFKNIQNKINRQMFHNYMEQIDEMSDQIINTIHLELEYSAHMLKNISETLEISPHSVEKSINSLKTLENKGSFLTLGVINNEGDFYDTEGNHKKIDMKDFLKNLNFCDKNGSFYVSDVIEDNEKITKEILIAVPIYEEEKMTGVLFGYYPILEITEEINITEKDYQFFQIIDSFGKYISFSEKKNMYLPPKSTVWKDMEVYNFSKEDSLERIRENVKNREKGTFSFSYGDNKFYVAYSPLRINNWYLFSTFTSEELEHRAREFQNISNELLSYLVIFMMLLLSYILSVAFYSYKTLEEQNKNIELKNQMFRMLADKTKDIFFEIHVAENTFALYNYSKGNEEILIPLESITPENMLNANQINKENFQIYENFYNNIFEKNIENTTIQLNIDGLWKWYRVNTVTLLDYKNIIGVLEDFTEKKNQEFEYLKISEKSKYDFLTKLYNRETFEAEFNKFVKESKDTNLINAFFLLDLDNFKKINDTFGHRTGDKVLMEAAAALKNSVRNTDLIGRLGGDEFVLLIKDLPSLEVLHKIAGKINSALIKTYTSKTGEKITVSCSIGISVIHNEMNFKRVYKNADRCLYQVKNNGRNSYLIIY